MPGPQHPGIYVLLILSMLPKHSCQGKNRVYSASACAVWSQCKPILTSNREAKSVTKLTSKESSLDFQTPSPRESEFEHDPLGDASKEVLAEIPLHRKMSGCLRSLFIDRLLFNFSHSNISMCYS